MRQASQPRIGRSCCRQPGKRDAAGGCGNGGVLPHLLVSALCLRAPPRDFDAHEAEDLTQEFFVRLIAKNYLADVDREKGKFRAFLLAALKHFLTNERRRRIRKSVAVEKIIISLDTSMAESRYRREPFHNLTPERLFERQWILTVLDRVLVVLQAEWPPGKTGDFGRAEAVPDGGTTLRPAMPRWPGNWE